MKKLAYMFLGLLAMSAIACEEEHELRLDDDSQRLLVQCLPGLSDTTFVMVRSTIPVTQKDSIAPDISDAAVALKVNGSSVPLTKARGGSDGLPDGTYYNVGKLSPGDLVELEVSAKGLDPVYGSTVIPEPLDDLKYEFKPIAGTHYMSWDIDLSSGSSNDFYAFQILYHTYTITEYRPYIGIEYDEFGNFIKYEKGDLVSDTTDVIASDYLSKVVDNDLGLDVSDEMVDVYLYHASLLYFGQQDHSTRQRLYIVSPGMLDANGHFTFVSSRWLADQEESQFLENGELEYRLRQSNKYKLVAYRLSPEFYRFAKSRYDVGNNEMGFLGLAPASFTYTNIKGGFGVVGAATMYETDWMKKTD